MLVVHLTLTPLAGAPIRIVQALNQWTDIEARLINFNPRAYGSRTFDEDIDFSNDRIEARAIIEDADIVHCHHWINLQYNPFGIDLRDKCVIRHFHSEPGFVAHHAGIPIESILYEEIPQLVVAQHQERYYPNARPVPNLLNLEKIEVSKRNKLDTKHDQITVGFHPTSDQNCFSERWNTKGANETFTFLNRLKSECGFAIECDKELPHEKLIGIRANCDILFDEMVTGAYHLTGLESLALGKPTFGFLDNRSIINIVEITGCSTLPWLNFSLDAFETVFREILSSKDLRNYIGEASKEWIRQYWNEQKLVRHFTAAYEDVLSGKRCLRETAVDPIFAVGIHDIRWQENMKNLIRKLNA